jgi:hypothetical protein
MADSLNKINMVTCIMLFNKLLSCNIFVFLLSHFLKFCASWKNSLGGGGGGWSPTLNPMGHGFTCLFSFISHMLYLSYAWLHHDKEKQTSTTGNNQYAVSETSGSWQMTCLSWVRSLPHDKHLTHVVKCVCCEPRAQVLGKGDGTRTT